MDLKEVSERLLRADEEMAALFERRMETLRELTRLGRERGIPVDGSVRSDGDAERLTALIRDPELRPYYARFLQDTDAVGKRWQHRLAEGLRVAYSGTEGAFAHIAVRRIFPDGAAIGYPSFESAYAAAESGECDIAVLPIENSYAGEVGQVLDLMFSGAMYVNGVYDLAVSQNLLGVPGATVGDVRTVVSHPQALSQCHEYIRRHGFEERSAGNTATAAREIAALNDVSVAAIASSETAELYGLTVLDHDINESRANTTRFAVFSRTERTPEAKRAGGAFLLLFTVKDEVGGLAKAINIISAYNFNLRVLRSRPLKELPWHYYFYAEAEGEDTSENGKRMIGALRGICPMVRIVGRYTAAGNSLQGGETI